MGSTDDLYSSMTELLQSEEVEEEDYKIEVEEGRNSQVVVMAPHGGGIERHTDDLAREIAGGEFAFYTFRGTMADGNWDLHVTSTNFDEPKAVDLVEQAQVVLAVHGKEGEGEFAMVGGRHSELADRIEDLLRELDIETRDPPPRVAAKRLANICNRCQEGGVQLELSCLLRERLQSDGELRIRFAQGCRRVLHQATSTSG